VDKDEALKLALEALQWNWGGEPLPTLELQAINAIKEVLAQPKPVQVSPLDFVTMTLEKEHLVGRPIIWAQWPNEEKST
jgi:hypothetical protein